MNQTCPHIFNFFLNFFKYLDKPSDNSESESDAPDSASAINQPRGRMSAYAFFVKSCQEEHKLKHPNETVGFSKFSTECAKKWRDMNSDEKNKFILLAEKDKKRYDDELSEYQDSLVSKVN